MKNNFWLSEEKNIQMLYSWKKLNTRLSIWDSYWTSKIKFDQWIFEHIQHFLGDNLLDIWCWTWRMWKKLFENKRKWHYTWVDVSKEMINQTYVSLKNYSNRVDLVLWNIENEVISLDKFYKVITAIHVLHHAGDLKIMLQNIRKLGNQHSTFFFTCSNMDISEWLNWIHYDAVNKLKLPIEMQNTDYLFFQKSLLYKVLKDLFSEVKESSYENWFACPDINLVMSYYKSAMKYRWLSDIEWVDKSLVDALDDFVAEAVKIQIDKTWCFYHPANVTLYMCRL